MYGSNDKKCAVKNEQPRVLFFTDHFFVKMIVIEWLRIQPFAKRCLPIDLIATHRLSPHSWTCRDGRAYSRDFVQDLNGSVIIERIFPLISPS